MVRRPIQVMLVGAVGSLLVALCGWFTSVPFRPTPPLWLTVLLRFLAGIGLAAWCVAWWWGRRFITESPRRAIPILALWTLPLLLSPALMSRDAWAYAAQGQILARGGNPYVTPQGAADTLGHLVDHHWAGSTAVYPPGSLWIQAAMVRLAGEHPYWSTVAMRIPALVGLVLIALALVQIARLTGLPSGDAIWLGACNPVVLAHAVGGMHNDALQCGVALVAIAIAGALARRGQSWLGLVAGGAVVGLAGLVKQPGVLAGLGVVALVCQCSVCGERPRRNATWATLILQLAAAAVPAVLVFGGVSTIRGLGVGWLSDTAGSPLQVTSDSPVSLIVQTAVRFGADIDVLQTPVTIASLVVTVVAIIWCWSKWGPLPERTGDPMMFQASVCLAFVVCGVAIQPWYFLFPLVVVAVTPLATRHSTLLAYVSVLLLALSGVRVFLSPFVAVPIIAFVGWLGWRHGKLNTPSSDERAAEWMS